MPMDEPTLAQCTRDSVPRVPRWFRKQVSDVRSGHVCTAEPIRIASVRRTVSRHANNLSPAQFHRTVSTARNRHARLAIHWIVRLLNGRANPVFVNLVRLVNNNNRKRSLALKFRRRFVRHRAQLTVRAQRTRADRRGRWWTNYSSERDKDAVRENGR